MPGDIGKTLALNRDIEQIEAAIRSGVRTVTFEDGRSVTYRDLNEMERALKLAKTHLASADPTVVPRRRTRRIIVFQ